MPAASGLLHTRIVWQAAPQRFRDGVLAVWVQSYDVADLSRAHRHARRVAPPELCNPLQVCGGGVDAVRGALTGST
jgi:hypothetical protein